MTARYSVECLVVSAAAAATVCRELYTQRKWLWTFPRNAQESGLPTPQRRNVALCENLAHTLVREAAYCRRLLRGGGDSLIDTCRQQDGNVFDLATAVIEAHLGGR